MLAERRRASASRRTPVLMLGADATAHSRERLLSPGTNDYLSKPFNVYELLGKLDALLPTAPGQSRAPDRPG